MFAWWSAGAAAAVVMKSMALGVSSRVPSGDVGLGGGWASLVMGGDHRKGQNQVYMCRDLPCIF